ncbi:MAG: hypothetical protein NXI16_02430 [Alphaproteobacteria bacterium]|nr:hypothetical protein [Alphaproteobacteria bacterium]
MRGTEPVSIYVNVIDPLTAFTGAGHFITYCYEGLHSTGMPVDYSIDYVARPNALNIIVDSFDTPYAQDVVARRVRSGGQHILVATEFLTGDTFNDIGERTDSYYDDKEWWRERFERFHMIASTAQAIWVSTDHQIDAYRAAYPGIPILRLPFCFSSQWNHRLSRVPDKLYDVFFTGAATDRRKRILGGIASRARVYNPPGMYDSLYVQIGSQARIGLHLKLKDGWPYTSPMRHLSLLHCDTYIISEKCDLPGELDPFIEVVAEEDLADVVVERLRDPDLPQKTRRQRAAFMKSGNIKLAFADLLKQSLAVA